MRVHSSIPHDLGRRIALSVAVGYSCLQRKTLAAERGGDGAPPALVECCGAKRSGVSRPSGADHARILGFDTPVRCAARLLNQRMLGCALRATLRQAQRGAQPADAAPARWSSAAKRSGAVYRDQAGWIMLASLVSIRLSAARPGYSTSGCSDAPCGLPFDRLRVPLNRWTLPRWSSAAERSGSPRAGRVPRSGAERCIETKRGGSCSHPWFRYGLTAYSTSGCSDTSSALLDHRVRPPRWLSASERSGEAYASTSSARRRNQAG